MKMDIVSLPRLVLFLAGAVILGLLIWFGVPPILWQGNVIAFLIVAALLVYAALLLPVVFHFVLGDGMIVGGIIYFRGAVLFGVLSLGLMLWALLSQDVSKLLIVLELAVIFVFAVYILISYYTASHVTNVRNAEMNKKDALDCLKSRALQMQTTVDLKTGDQEVRTAVKKLAESIRFLSPSEAPEARRLEEAMIQKLTTLDLRTNAMPDLQELESMLRQRKSIY